MPIRAQADKKFNLRFLLISLVALGFGCWFLYDAIIGYPKELTRSEGFYEKVLSSDGDGPAWKPVDADVWQQRAKENDWSLAKPKDPDEMRSKIFMQYAMAVMSFLVGIPALIHFLRTGSAWIEADEKAIWNSFGQKCEFQSIRSVDKSRWEKKGIAKVQYEQDGTSKTFVIDDLKFDRKCTDEIMMLLESKIDAKLVSGAPLERELVQNQTDTRPRNDSGGEDVPDESNADSLAE